jgi:hypothetical protein
VAPPPRETGDPIPFVGAQLLAERASNPVAFDERYRGKLLLLRGTYARTVGENIYLAEGANDPTFIICTPPVITRKPIHELPPETLQPGQAVIVRGWYSADLRLYHCQVVATAGPADAEYRNKEIELVGVVGRSSAADAESTERFPTVYLAPPVTDCPVSVRCLFRLTEREHLETLKPGQIVTVRGRCEGRSYNVVRLHDCLLIPNTDPPPTGVARVASDRFFAAYEVDLLPFVRPNLATPVAEFTADQLVAAYTANPRRANANYQYKTIVVSGRVHQRSGQSVIFETSTSQRYQVQAVFTGANYAALKDRKDLVIRGVCMGIAGQYVPYVVLHNAQLHDPDSDNPAVRTLPDYLPLRPGQELQYDVLTPTDRKEHPITRINVAVVGVDLVRTTPMRLGTYPRPSLFSDPAQPRWTRDFTKLKGGPPATLAEYRVSDGTVEARDKPPPPAQPGAWWDPVFKFGMRKGESWSTMMLDGRTVSYRVSAFGKDAAGRHTVEITRITKRPQDATTWEEAVITYAYGVGEVRRVITKQAANGKAITLVEMQLVASEPPGKKDGKKDDK